MKALGRAYTLRRHAQSRAHAAALDWLPPVGCGATRAQIFARRCFAMAVAGTVPSARLPRALFGFSGFGRRSQRGNFSGSEAKDE